MSNLSQLKVTKLVFWVGLCLALIGSLVSLAGRYRVEQSNKATGIAVEIQTVIDLGNAQGLSLAESLKHLNQQGLTYITINEETAAEYFATGQLRLQNNWQPQIWGEKKLIRRLADAAELRTGTRPTTGAIPDGPDILELGDRPLDFYRNLNIGLDSEQCAAAKAAKLRIIARLSNPVGVNPGYIEGVLTRAAKQGVSVYLPLGEQVLGQRNLVKFTAENLERNKILYATPEFSKISGDAQLAGLTKHQLIRLHAIQTNEVDKLSPAEFYERFVKASRERSMRLLLLRPLSTAAENPLYEFGDQIKEVTRKLILEGGAVGEAKPFTESEHPKWATLLIGLGIFLAGLWVSITISQSPIIRIGGIAVSAISVAAAMVSPGIAALIAAMIFPIAAYLLIDSFEKLPAPVTALVMSGISLVGGLCVSGLLNNLDYMVKLDTFPAVKLAHFGPIFIIAIFLTAKLVDFKAVMQEPVRYAHLFFGFIGLMVLAFMAVRTGNDAPGSVSGVELKMRSLLEHFLYVRPRTKEILMGHPALFFGLFALAAHRANPEKKSLLYIGTLAITAGAIGQTSIVNTMCHLHTPLEVGLVRIAIGLVIGAIFGTMGWLVLKPVLTRDK